jgi:hypothetical protein
LIITIFLKILNLLKKKSNLDSTFLIYIPQKNRREVYKWYLKVIKPLIKLTKQSSPSSTAKLLHIDIIIPTVQKDIDFLERVIEGCRNNINHTITNIFIVAPFSQEIISIAQKLDCVYVDEKNLTNINKEDIVYTINGDNRNGWLYQQILKLNGDKISINEHFLIIDSDTILTQPHNFIYKNKIIFNHSDECHIPYYKSYKNIFGYEKTSSLSFVCHYMLFSKKYLKEMKAEIEKINKNNWELSILKNVIYDDPSGFSEYETYGNFMLKRHKNKIIREYWFNLSVVEIPHILPNFIKSISLHSYNIKD